MERKDIINKAVEKYGYSKYLEIGLFHPTYCFDHIKCSTKHSVDPGYENPWNMATYKFESDKFFELLESNELDLEADYKWDIIFIDGLHTCEQVEKDIINSMRHLSENGTIVLHDCNPPTEYHTRAAQADHHTVARNEWTGTVWKAVYKNVCQNTEMMMCVVDTDFGCGVMRPMKRDAIEMTNPFFEFSKFDTDRISHLNLIQKDQIDGWLDEPYMIQLK